MLQITYFLRTFRALSNKFYQMRNFKYLATWSHLSPSAFIIHRQIEILTRNIVYSTKSFHASLIRFSSFDVWRSRSMITTTNACSGRKTSTAFIVNKLLANDRNMWSSCSWFISLLLSIKKLTLLPGRRRSNWIKYKQNNNNRYEKLALVLRQQKKNVHADDTPITQIFVLYRLCIGLVVCAWIHRLMAWQKRDFNYIGQFLVNKC